MPQLDDPAPLRRLLIANRGEIAIRIARAAARIGIETVMLCATDEADALHARAGDRCALLPGSGPAAYLDASALIEAATAHGCDAVHPGYGFLSESAAFAEGCAQAGLRFVGPAPQTLAQFGDKARARAVAHAGDVPVLDGGAVTGPDEVAAFLDRLGAGGAAMLKAVAGGGGRGMRALRQGDDVASAYRRCASEARAAFGDERLYVERLMPHARHIEVQLIGDGAQVAVLGERDCSLQRRHQKLVEIAPAPGLAAALRERLFAASRTLGLAVRLRSLCTIEFLVDATSGDFAFIEANPRLQVEHTITEAVTGLDLVVLQLRIAAGARLPDLGLGDTPPAPRGHAVQARVNAETYAADGSPQSVLGTISGWLPPSGPGVRVDGCGYAGLRVTPAYDALLAKLVAHVESPDPADALALARRAAEEFVVDGVETNLALLRALLACPELADGVDTAYLPARLDALRSAAAPARYALETGTAVTTAATAADTDLETEGCTVLRATLAGTVVAIEATVGEALGAGSTVLVLEAMKMEHLQMAPAAGQLKRMLVGLGDTLAAGQPLALIEDDAAGETAPLDETRIDLDAPRADLDEVRARQARLADAARPATIAKRHAQGGRSARENVADLVDAGSFCEYGGLALAAQRRVKSVEQLIEESPADGIVTGTATVNAAQFGAEAAGCALLAYDYTVFAGTQGVNSHKKTDRMLRLAERARLPLVLFAEGGGGRPNDTDSAKIAGLDVETFLGIARLSGQVPTLAIVHGRCFAGNAALAGCCDTLIATESASIGMAGPAMIEGGGLGRYRPEEVGPVSVQAPNGVIDIVVRDEAEAVAVARRYLGYFQGRLADWRCADQRVLRQLVPENRKRVYDMRRVIDALADADSVTELRRAFAPAMITALLRVDGRAFGLIANDPAVLGGAIDAAAGDKAARFLQLCDAHGLPVISLCDTPGFMVGPDAERDATVRHVSRLFVVAAQLSVPVFTVVTRKGYGLGAMAMAGGSFHASAFTVAWPTSEFGGMGLEGRVRLGYRKQLEAIADPTERQRHFDALVAQAYEQGKGLNLASVLEIDNVIDPAETRAWLVRGLQSQARRDPPRSRGRFIDTW